MRNDYDACSTKETLASTSPLCFTIVFFCALGLVGCNQINPMNDFCVTQLQYEFESSEFQPVSATVIGVTTYSRNNLGIRKSSDFEKLL